MANRETQPATKFERLLIKKLEELDIQYEVNRKFTYTRDDGYQGEITPDLCIPSLQLAVEVDGIHHEWPKYKSIDQLRDKTIRSHGFKVIRVPNNFFSEENKMLAFLEDLQNAFLLAKKGERAKMSAIVRRCWRARQRARKLI